MTAGVIACVQDQPMREQNPSPMVEHTRTHDRIEPAEVPGRRWMIEGIVDQPVRVFLPASLTTGDRPALLIHFHGAPWVLEPAVAEAAVPWILVSFHLGNGSSAYESPFLSPGLWDRMIAAVEDSVGETGGRYVSAFSAGYGAVRALLRRPEIADRIEGVLLLDGLLTGYVPVGIPLAGGGVLQREKLEPFLDFARRAVEGGPRMVITHSEIFPGTYASTTESTDYLLERLALRRTPVLAWGPVGMQQTSEVMAGGFQVLGFAGNTAPDHVDHLHGYGAFLALLRGGVGEPPRRSTNP